MKKHPSHLFRCVTFHRKAGMVEWLMMRADVPTMALAVRWAHIARFGYPQESRGPIRVYPELTAR